jgi:hypothetical protein
MLTSCKVDSVFVEERLSSLMAAKDLFVPTDADAMARISEAQELPGGNFREFRVLCRRWWPVASCRSRVDSRYFF